ncbi:MAG TPA: UvrD-helicase domain-containing protein [Chthoniobacterales bacterium]
MQRAASNPDQAAIDRFCREIDRNFSLIAGAGAGKTRGIVERIVTIALKGGADLLPRLVVVTYTNNAAREFRHRVRSALLERMSRESARAILEKLELTFFGTIHSFCMKLLREHQAELRLPDQLTPPGARARNQLWEAFVSNDAFNVRFADDPLVKELLRFCTWQDILNIAQRIPEPILREPVSPSAPVLDLEPLRCCTVKSQSAPARDELLKNFERLIADIAAGKTSLQIPFPDSKAEGLIRAYQAVAGSLISWLEDASLSVATGIALEFQRHCWRLGIVTYDDQVTLCKRLLKDQAILDQLRRREYIVILDEAQDTALSMFEILLELTRPAGALAGSWPDSGSGPRQGRFCMVGDPRQTIYERAGMQFYQKLNEAFRRGLGGELVLFRVTRRCAAAVVAAVNRVFRDSMLTEHEMRYDDLVACEATGEGYVGRIQIPALGADLTQVEKIFEEECRVLAGWLGQQKKAGLGIQSWNQVAVLAPRHDWLIACAVHLERAGLRYRYRNQRIPWSNLPAFTWPVALLYTVAHPWDQFERIGVLREIFAISDADLAKWILDPYSASPALKEAQRVLANIEDELTLAPRPTLARIVDRLFVECQLAARFGILDVDPAGLEVFRVLAFEAEGKLLHDWVDELLALLIESAGESFASADAIELITTFSAKGLEWDMVIPLGFGRRIYPGRNTGYPLFVMNGPEQRVIWNAASQSTGRDESDGLHAAWRRLLYVTLTRAKHSLLIPAMNYVDPRDSFAAASGFDLAEIAEFVGPLSSIPKMSRDTWAQLDLPIDVVDFKQATARSLDVPDLIRPHALAKDDEVVENQFTEDAATYTYGRWWHLWIEKFPWKASRNEQEAYAASIEPDLPFVDRAREETVLFLKSSALTTILSTGKWYRSEVSFSFPKDGAHWIEGIIDLVVGTQSDQLWVIDWKTNQIPSETTEDYFAADLRRKYLPQLEAYREVIEKGFHKRIARLLIYSTVVGRFM